MGSSGAHKTLFLFDLSFFYHFYLCFRSARAVPDYGGLLTVHGGPAGGEGASRSRRGGEVLRQLVRGAQLLLAKRGASASAVNTAAVSSLMLLETCHFLSIDVTSLYIFSSHFQLSFGLMALPNCLASPVSITTFLFLLLASPSPPLKERSVFK